MHLMPENIATFGNHIDSLAWLITVIGGTALVISELVLFFFVFRFRKKEGQRASYINGTKWKQLQWIFVPVFVVILLDLYIDEETVKPWTLIKDHLPSNPEQVVRVTAQQFSWSFTYPGPDNKMNTSDDITIPKEFHVKANVDVVFDLEAKDVLHSFWVPNLRLKQDIIPGRTIKGWFNAMKPGTYEIACAEICGTGHSLMRASLIVHDEQDYLKWQAITWKKAGESSAALAEGALPGAALIKAKGCTACHSIDGSKIVGPSYKGLFGSKRTVLSNGQEHEIVADEAYIKHSMMAPNDDVVKGFQPVMPPQKGLVSDAEAEQIIDYIKSLK